MRNFTTISILLITISQDRYDYSERVISPSQRPPPDNIQHSQQTSIHVLGGIRTHNLGRQAAADLRLRISNKQLTIKYDFIKYLTQLKMRSEEFDNNNNDNKNNNNITRINILWDQVSQLFNFHCLCIQTVSQCMMFAQR